VSSCRGGVVVVVVVVVVEVVVGWVRRRFLSTLDKFNTSRNHVTEINKDK
jgi:hypothetical protein